MKTVKTQKGFTIIEIIIVVIILGLLAVTALPRFLDTVDEAEDASLEGVTGAFATAVGLVRAQWEVSGRPKGSLASGAAGANQEDVSFVTIDNKRVGVDGTTVHDAGSSRTLGFPTASVNAAGVPVSVVTTTTEAAAMTDARCLEVFNTILQSPPAAAVNPGGLNATQLAALFADNKFIVAKGVATPVVGVCFYFQSNGLNAMPTLPTTATVADVPDDAAYNYFWYNPATGVVQSVRNKA